MKTLLVEPLNLSIFNYATDIPLKNGTTAKELGRELSVSPNTLYNWKKRFHDMTVSEARRMRELESENAKLQKLVAEQALDILMLKDVNSRKW